VDRLLITKRARFGFLAHSRLLRLREVRRVTNRPPGILSRCWRSFRWPARMRFARRCHRRNEPHHLRRTLTPVALRRRGAQRGQVRFFAVSVTLLLRINPPGPVGAPDPVNSTVMGDAPRSHQTPTLAFLRAGSVPVSATCPRTLPVRRPPA